LYVYSEYSSAETEIADKTKQMLSLWTASQLHTCTVNALLNGLQFFDTIIDGTHLICLRIWFASGFEPETLCNFRSEYLNISWTLLDLRLAVTWGHRINTIVEFLNVEVLKWSIVF